MRWPLLDCSPGDRCVEVAISGSSTVVRYIIHLNVYKFGRDKLLFIIVIVSVGKGYTVHVPLRPFAEHLIQSTCITVES